MTRRLRKRTRKYRTRHHLVPKSIGGTWDTENLLILWNDHHEVWHWLFGNKNLSQIISLLIRVRRMKRKIKTS